MLAHTARFYNDEVHLIRNLARFVTDGLAANEGVFVASSRMHYSELKKQLLIQKIPVETFRLSGQLIFIDSEKALDRLLVNQKIDDKRFEQIFDLPLEKLREKYPAVRAYGDLVNELCAKGQHELAINLEEKWNDLTAKNHMTLLCSYRLKHFADAELSTQFDRICKNHAHVFPSERFSEEGDLASLMVKVAKLEQKNIALQARVEHLVKNNESRPSRKEASRWPREISEPVKNAAYEELSERERLVFQMISKGKALKEISSELQISIKTVSTYRARILKKMLLKSNADIIRYCIIHKIT